MFLIIACSSPGPKSVEGQAVVKKRNSLFSNHIHRPYSLNYSLGSLLEEEEEEWEEEKGREKGSKQQLDKNKFLSLSLGVFCVSGVWFDLSSMVAWLSSMQ